MAGDCNLFFNDLSDDPTIAEIEIMIAGMIRVGVLQIQNNKLIILFFLFLLSLLLLLLLLLTYVDPKSRGKGIAKESLTMLMSYAVTELGVTKFVAKVMNTIRYNSFVCLWNFSVWLAAPFLVVGGLGCSRLMSYFFVDYCQQWSITLAVPKTTVPTSGWRECVWWSKLRNGDHRWCKENASAANSTCVKDKIQRRSIKNIHEHITSHLCHVTLNKMYQLQNLMGCLTRNCQKEERMSKGKQRTNSNGNQRNTPILPIFVVCVAAKIHKQTWVRSSTSSHGFSWLHQYQPSLFW